MPLRLSLLTCLTAFILLRNPAPLPAKPFQITIVDDQTGRGVPLVELQTTNAVRYVTDSNGIVAFDEPGLMNQSVFFTIRSHGYEFPKDGFGYAGKGLTTTEGGAARISIKRLNVAQRLYRVTGQGIYRDSLLTGQPIPLRNPVLNGQVTGQDSVQALPYRGKLYWFWGDTNRPSYPLGHFGMAGATSELPDKGGLDPDKGVDLTYFVDDKGFSRPTAPMKEGGMIWLGGFLTLPDETGQERMLARYSRMKSLGEMLEHGLMLFNDQTQTFEKILAFDLKDQFRCPRGHPLRFTENNQEYFYFPAPFPITRVKADLKSLRDPAAYEAFTCLPPAAKYQKDKTDVDRTPDGKLVYAWKLNTGPTGQIEEKELIAAGKLKPDEARFQVRDIDTDKSVEMADGSIYWNDFRKRYIMIAVQIGGTSMLGEIWFTEADSPTGPWTLAKKIVTHDQYSFYNPKHHPFFDQQAGRIIYFEGTYTETFSGNPAKTPRYDYNQIMYRLDLADPRLKLEPKQ
jgi:hypothetical protein